MEEIQNLMSGDPYRGESTIAGPMGIQYEPNPNSRLSLYINCFIS